MNKLRYLTQASVAAAMLAAAACGGCNSQIAAPGEQVQASQVPEPLGVLLPKKMRIHSFTGTREFSDAGGIKGIDVRIRADDGYGDATKAFGQFRFELFRYKPTGPDHKAARIAVWTVDVADVKSNRRHWNSIMKTYQFKLGWDEAIPVGRKFVLTAAFDSRFTKRLFDEHVFVSGE